MKQKGILNRQMYLKDDFKDNYLLQLILRREYKEFVVTCLKNYKEIFLKRC